MARIDPNADLFPLGWHLFEVMHVESKWTKKDDEQWAIRLRDVHTNRTHYERWFATGQWVGMTVPKLKALGMDFSQDIQGADLVGRRFYGEVGIRKGKDGYPDQAQIGKCRSENDPPEGFAAPEKPAEKVVDADDIVF